MSTIAKLGIVVMCMFGGCVALCGKAAHDVSQHAGTARAEEAPREAASRVPTMRVDARKLWKDYEANEVAADNVYKGRVIAVDGEVASIDKDFLDNIVVHLESPNQFMPTSATMQNSEAAAAASLAKGVSVTVVCEVQGRIVGTPSLRECTFAR